MYRLCTDTTDISPYVIYTGDGTLIVSSSDSSVISVSGKNLIIKKAGKVTKISKDAFKDVENVKKIIIECRYIKKIDKKAFNGLDVIIKLKGKKKDKKRVIKLLNKAKIPKTIKIT